MARKERRSKTGDGDTFSDYFALLRDPRWQRRRLEALNAYGWACNRCNAVDKELQVHHRYYAKGLKPWEYEPESLIALCGPCHKEAERLRKFVIRLFGISSSSDDMRIIGYMQALIAIDSDGGIGIEVLTYEHAQGISDVARLTPEEVIRLALDKPTKSVFLKRNRGSVEVT